VVGLLLGGLLFSTGILDELATPEGQAHFRSLLEPWGAWGVLAVGLVFVGALALGAPRSLLSLAVGALYGSRDGPVFACVATVLGCTLSFAIVRALRAPPTERSPRLARLDRALQRNGLLATLTLRLIPIGHCQATNVLLALSSVRPWEFVLGTALGVAPQAVAVALIGAGASTGSMRTAAVGSGALCVIAAVTWFLRRRRLPGESATLGG